MESYEHRVEGNITRYRSAEQEPSVRELTPEGIDRTLSTTPQGLTLGEVLMPKLLATGHIRSCHDYCQVATRLQCDWGKDRILAMEELERWPKAHAWLQERL